MSGQSPRASAMFADDHDIAWVTDFGGNAIHRFDPASAMWATFPLPSQPGNVRQILGRPGEVWAPESAAESRVAL